MPGFAAEAFYQLGEIRRQAGDLVDAEAAFRRASDLGHEPQPGLALVRLAQGKPDVAGAAVRRALAQEPARLARAKLLSAQVAIEATAGDLSVARRAADELGEIARDYGSVALEAAAASADGVVQLAADPSARGATLAASRLGAMAAADCPFEAAEARRVLGLACRKVGDDEGGELALRS
jgi:tetratricopeptide (TPR) repeat protein